MPHLDAKALTDDPLGMEFLAKVVGAPSEPALPVVRISVPDEAVTVLTTVDRLADGPLRKRRRRIAALVPEAA